MSNRGAGGGNCTSAGGAGAGFLALARNCAGVVGYAFVRLEQGFDDTFPFGERYAELYSLSVAPGWRGQGIGTLLLDFVDAELAARGNRDLTIAVMVGNAGAQRLYERRGLRPRRDSAESLRTGRVAFPRRQRRHCAMRRAPAGSTARLMSIGRSPHVQRDTRAYGRPNDQGVPPRMPMTASRDNSSECTTARRIVGSTRA